MTRETGRSLPYLDGWRGCAIGAVLVGHFLLDTVVPGLSMFGVQLFFVLSGRLMAEILFVRRAPLPGFYVRRISRVFPALAVFVIACAIIFHHFSGGKGYAVSWKGAIAALTFTINYAMLRTHTVLLFDHLWSLCVEEHGYILLSIVAFLARRYRLPVVPTLSALWVLTAANGIWRADILKVQPLYVLWRSDVTVATIAAAAVCHLLFRDRRAPRSTSGAMLVIGILASLRMSTFSSNFVFAGLCLALSVTSLDERSFVLGPVLSHRWLGKLGRASFSLYLWQQPFYKMLRYGFAPLSTLAPMMVGASALSFLLVEGPARRAINGWWDREAAPS